MSSTLVNSKQESPPNRVRIIKVWDLPVRVFHWLLASLVITAAVTGKIGGDAMELHQQAGYGIIILVAFRLLWGCVGTTYARFGSFVRGLSSTAAYCRELIQGRPPVRPGHNPLGGWMVLMMLTLLAIQTGTGLFANDDILTEGPLFSLVSKATSDWLTALHKLNFNIVLAFAALHVAAIAFYRLVKRIDLIRPMLTGRMEVADPSLDEPPIPSQANALALILLAWIAAGFYLLVLWN